jgi:hypothetical protein
VRVQSLDTEHSEAKCVGKPWCLQGSVKKSWQLLAISRDE